MPRERIEALHRCEPAHTALLVIDMQHAFLDPGAALEVPAGRDVVPAIARLMDCCRMIGAPVIFTQFVYSTAVPCLRGDPFGVEHLPAPPGEPTGYGHPSGNCLIGPSAGQGADSADIVPELAPRPDELIVAGHTYDKFLGTPLDLALRSRGVTHLLVTGVTTDVCVNCTILAAANRDYRVTAVTDGMATIDPALHEACLKIWQRKFARLKTADEVIAELRADNATPAPAFDPEQALVLCSHSRDALRDMIDCFTDEVDTLFPRMRAALDQGDLAAVGRLGHRLKSVVLYLGAPAVLEATFRVEQFECSRDGELPAARDAVAALERQCHELRAGLQAYRSRP